MNKTALIIETTKSKGVQLSRKLSSKGYSVYCVVFDRESEDELDCDGVHTILTDCITEETIITAIGHVVKREGKIDLFLTSHTQPEHLMLTSPLEEDQQKGLEANTIVEMLMHSMRNREAGKVVNMLWKGEEFFMEYIDVTDGEPVQLSGRADAESSLSAIMESSRIELIA